MKLYITKPKHTKYGRIELDTPFESIEELIEHSTIWFSKPVFEKPFIDIFGDKFCWRWWIAKYRCSILFKHFPECEVKESIRELIKKSINSNFHENLHNRHYKWIGEIDVTLFRKKTSGNFNLYLTKPQSVWDIKYAGIDRFRIFFSKPELPLSFENENRYYIDGKFFRKSKEFENLCIEMWSCIKNSFDVQEENFLDNIIEQNHKNKQSSTEFIKEFFFDIKNN